MGVLAVIWGFFTKSQLGQKIGLVLICATIAGFGLRWYGNKQYYQGRDAGVKQGAEEMLHAQAKIWKAKEAEIAQLRQRVEAQGEEIALRAAELVTLRRTLEAGLAQIKQAAANQKEKIVEVAVQVPADQLDSAIRKVVAPASTVPPETPLQEGEKRTVLQQLHEYGAAKTQIASYETWIQNEQELVQKERDAFKQALASEQSKTELVAKERDLALEKVATYQSLYQTVTKKRGGFFCKLGKILTLGLHRCK